MNWKAPENPLGSEQSGPDNFPMLRFRDINKAPCTIQCSSIFLGYPVGESAVWLGKDNAKLKILASDAPKIGLETSTNVGWIDYPVPEGVALNAHMHLDREQVTSLIYHLQQWLETGHFD